MTKYGVGVGEDFPLDEDNRRPGEEGAEHEPGGPHPYHGEDWHRRRRQAREALRQMRAQMRAEWRARCREMHDRFRQSEPVEPADGVRADKLMHLAQVGIAALAVIGLAALLGRHHHR